MNTRSQLRRLVGRALGLALPVAVFTAAGLTYARVADPSYTARAYVIVVATDLGDVNAAVNFAQAYARIAGQGDVYIAGGVEFVSRFNALQRRLWGRTED